MSENEKPSDGLGALLGALGASSMHCRTIKNAETGGIGLLPQTMQDVDEWERQCIAMHEEQQRRRANNPDFLYRPADGDDDTSARTLSRG